MNTMKTMMAVAALALATGNVKAETVNNMVVGPYDKGDCGTVMDMYQTCDFTALAHFVADGKGLLIEAGTKVSVLHVDIFGGTEQVRPAGESRGVWVPIEFVNR
jgi:hypothetical protein